MRPDDQAFVDAISSLDDDEDGGKGEENSGPPPVASITPANRTIVLVKSKAICSMRQPQSPSAR